MITSTILKNLPVFSRLPSDRLKKLAQEAADVRLSPGQWLIRESEQPAFFVVVVEEILRGLWKNAVGQST